MCFYRRSEIPSSLVPIADKHHWGEADMEQVHFVSWFISLLMCCVRILTTRTLKRRMRTVKKRCSRVARFSSLVKLRPSLRL